MNKELETITKLKLLINKVKSQESKHIFGRTFDSYFEEYLNIIETALKRLEELEKILVEFGCVDDGGIDQLRNQLKLCKNQDEILQIIKEKGVDILKLKECKRCKLPKAYNTRSSYSYHKSLTQEEFDILKEVLL